MAYARWLINSLVILIACAVHGNGQPTSRILGAEDVAITDLPYVASVRLDTVHNCGGVIISQTHILTAAHCLFDVADKTKVATPERLSVRVGSVNILAGGRIIAVVKSVPHPDYGNFKNDIGILVLAETLTFTDRINAIAYAQSAADVPAAGVHVQTAGWGEQTNTKNPYRLQSTSFPIATDEVCLNAFTRADESIICIAHELEEGSCYGDAGNGAFLTGKVISIASFVIGGCGTRYPDVHSSVAYFADWIGENIAE